MVKKAGVLQKSLVSILMPVYNSFGYWRSGGKSLLVQALDSLLSQTYQNFELIILDNQSIDATPDICKGYAAKDPRVKYILDTQKRYPEGAIEYMASFMNGKYCMAANDDDVYHPDYILKMVDFLEKHKEADMVYSNSDLIDINGKTTRFRIVPKGSEYNFFENSDIKNFCLYLNKRNPVPIIFGVFKSEIFKKVLPFEPFDSLKANVDNFFFLNFFISGFKCHFIDESLFFYRDKHRGVVPSKETGMPGLDQPMLIWLYYVRHQIYFLNKINELIEKNKGLSEEKKLFLKCFASDSFVKHSLNLLEWIKSDYIKEQKDKIIYSELKKIINKKSNFFITQDSNINTYSDLDAIQFNSYMIFLRAKNSSEKFKKFNEIVLHCSFLLQAKSEIANELEIFMASAFYQFEKERNKIIGKMKEPLKILEKPVKNKLLLLAGNKNPKISVISPSLNTGKFLKDTIHSIANQSYNNFEHIVIDGGSTDETISILRGYPHIRWISEKDQGFIEAFRKGLALARGEYIMSCCISDGYLDEDWFKKCVDILDKDKEISLVWGFPQYMTEGGKLKEISYPQFHNNMPPQKTDFIYHWLNSGFWLPEGNFCVRKNVFYDCFPQCIEKEKNAPIDGWLEFNYSLNKRGYLPYFVPTVANFGRVHANQSGQIETQKGFMKERISNYVKKLRNYRLKLLLGRSKYKYRDGLGMALPYPFSISRYIIKQKFSFKNFVRIIGLFLGPAIKKMIEKKYFPDFIVNNIRKIKEQYGSN